MHIDLTSYLVKKSRSQLCRQHLPLEALYLVVGGLIVPPQENAAGTAAILDFCHVIITIKVLNHLTKEFRKVTTLNVLEVSSYPNSFQRYSSFSMNIIGDESAFFLWMLGVHPKPKTHSNYRIHKIVKTHLTNL